MAGVVRVAGVIRETEAAQPDQRRGDAQLPADYRGHDIVDFPVAGHRRPLAGGRVSPNGVAIAFPREPAAVGAKMLNRVGPVHPTGSWATIFMRVDASSSR